MYIELNSCRSVCAHVRTYVCMFVNMHLCYMHVCMYIFMDGWTHACTEACVYVHWMLLFTFSDMFASVCQHVFVCGVYARIGLYLCVYMCVHVSGYM
jgi:hypothetical protein